MNTASGPRQKDVWLCVHPTGDKQGQPPAARLVPTAPGLPFSTENPGDATTGNLEYGLGRKNGVKDFPVTQLGSSQ